MTDAGLAENGWFEGRRGRQACRVDPPALLTIIQYAEPEWKAIKASGKAPGPVVAEGGGRVFVAQFLPRNPSPAGSEDGVAIAPMLLTPEQVSKAMRIE